MTVETKEVVTTISYLIGVRKDILELNFAECKETLVKLYLLFDHRAGIRQVVVIEHQLQRTVFIKMRKQRKAPALYRSHVPRAVRRRFAFYEIDLSVP